MKTTKSFLNAVNEDLVRLNVRYSNVWRVATMQDFVGKKSHNVHAALVYVCARIDSEPEYWIYYNFDKSMGNAIGFTRRETAKEAEEEFANTLV